MDAQRNTIIHLPRSFSGGEMRKNVKIETDKPVLFLAGPVRNAPKWQEEAARLILKRNESIFVAIPVREFAEDLSSYVALDKPRDYVTFERWRAWEQYYLYAAAKNGCIVFWLPREAEEKEFPDKIYAHNTMLELGEWIARSQADDHIKLIIGTDGDFPEWYTIEYELKTELPRVPVCHSLKETIETALDLLKKS